MLEEHLPRPESQLLHTPQVYLLWLELTYYTCPALKVSSSMHCSSWYSGDN